MSIVLYLHGFQSSPQSYKAQLTKTYVAEHLENVSLLVPQLPNSPSKIAGQVLRLISANPSLQAEGLKIIGSSMGGYLATWLVEKFGGKAVLINPAVKPYELLANYTGFHVNPYTKERFYIAADDMTYLRALNAREIAAPEMYKVLLQTGDETLDYRQAEQKYVGSDMTIEQGGDHSFVNFERHLPAIFEFLLDR